MLNGVTYDGRVAVVTVRVSDNNKGKLDVTYNGETTFTTPYFSNKYNASGDGYINVKKVLIGRDWTSTDTFEFTISRVTADAPMPEGGSTLTITSADENDDYTKAFGKITFVVRVSVHKIDRRSV